MNSDMYMNFSCLRSCTLFIMPFLFTFLFFNEKVFAHEGWGIVVDKNGQVYFSDIPTNTIWKITLKGELKIAAPNQHSHALIKGGDGNIYGTHENGRLWKISADEYFSEILPPASDFPLNLHCFIIDGNGNIFSMNTGSVQSGNIMLLKRTPDGTITTVAGGKKGYKDGNGIEAQFKGIDGMAWGIDSSLYLTDGPYVRKVTMDGVVSTIGGKLTYEKLGEDLMGITTTLLGELLVADYSSRRILKINKEEKIQTIFKSGSIWSPTGIAVFENEIYVLEHLRMELVVLGNIGIDPYVRIRKISVNGNVSTLTTVWGKNTCIFIVVLAAIILLVYWFKSFRHKRKKRVSL